MATAAVLVVAGGLAVAAAALTERSLARLELVDARLREVGRFTEARARLQQFVILALPPTLQSDHSLVVDLRIQIDQARSLGPRLPDDVRLGLDQLARALRQPLVLRSDLVAAAALLDEITSAESAVHARIFDEARSDARTELAAVVVVLLVVGGLAILALWVVPDRIVDPLRRRLRESTRALLARERELAQAQQMALLGEAAATLAHEVRNPLAGVALGLQNLGREREDLGPRLTPLQAEIERVTRTLKEYLGRVHAGPGKPEDVDLAAAVEDLAELLRYQAPPGVRVVNRVGGGHVVRVPPDALRQVVLNLGINAMEAMDSRGGTLTFEARREEAGRTVLAVLDNGPGFPPDVLADRTEPFTSLKEGGSGIGLRVVRRLTAEMGALLRLSNRPKGGARVELSLPGREEQP